MFDYDRGTLEYEVRVDRADPILRKASPKSAAQREQVGV
jgi:hypothetical protein